MGAVVRPLPPAQAEHGYARLLEARVRGVHAALMAEITALLKRRVDPGAEENKRTDSAAEDLDAILRVVGNADIAAGMVKASETKIGAVARTVSATATAQQKALMKSVIGIDFTAAPRVDQYQAAWVQRNVDLIRSVDKSYFQGVRETVTKAVKEGKSNADITALLGKQLGVTQARAQLIAVDQVAKLNADITKYHQVRLGVTRYKWSTSRDSRVRAAHKALDGKIFSWDQPPPGGHPGTAVRCRCIALPVVDDAVLAAGKTGGAARQVEVPKPGKGLAHPAAFRGAQQYIEARAAEIGGDREAARLQAEAEHHQWRGELYGQTRAPGAAKAAEDAFARAQDAAREAAAKAGNAGEEAATAEAPEAKKPLPAVAVATEVAATNSVAEIAGGAVSTPAGKAEETTTVAATNSVAEIAGGAVSTPAGKAEETTTVAVTNSVAEIAGGAVSTPAVKPKRAYVPTPETTARLKKLDETGIAGHPTTTTAKEIGKGEVSLEVEFKTPGGKAIGKAQRSMTRMPDGSWHVEHDSFSLDDEQQGKGIAKAFFEQSDAMYADIGAKSVGVTAGGKVGRYAWSQFGFDFAAESERNAMARSFKKQLLAKYPGMSEGEADGHLIGLKRSWEFADLTVGGERVGKDFMLNGPAWQGLRSLDPATESFQRGAAYYSKTAAKAKGSGVAVVDPATGAKKPADDPSRGKEEEERPKAAEKERRPTEEGNEDEAPSGSLEAARRAEAEAEEAEREVEKALDHAREMRARAIAERAKLL